MINNISVFLGKNKGYQKIASKFNKPYHLQARNYCEATSKISSFSNEKFWQAVEKVPSVAARAPDGKLMDSSLDEDEVRSSLRSNGTSEYVDKFLIKTGKNGIALDLGCGTGANSRALYQSGWKVIAIDNQDKLIRRCNEKSNFPPYDIYSPLKPIVFSPDFNLNFIKANIVTYQYPTNVDTVIAVDVLPYILPVHLKKTMEKIFQALRPGGKFIGTLNFKIGTLNFKSDSEDDNTIFKSYEERGMHFYPGEEFTSEIVIRSGFKIKLMRVPPYRLRFTTLSLEFLAEKPA